MQSFCGGIRLVRRHNINSSKIVDFISTRKFPASRCSDLGISNGVGAFNFVGTSMDYSKDCLFRSLPKFTSRSLVELTKSGIQMDLLTSSNNGSIPWVAPVHRATRTSLFHQSAAVQTLPSRCISTMHDSVKSVAEDTSAPISDISPRIKFKRLDKTARHIMQILDKEAVVEVRKQKEIPDIRPGYIVQLKVEAPMNKRRVSIFKGTIIAMRNAGLNSTFRLRRLVAGVGVESLFPLYSPNIKEIKVLEKKRVRRAKLYYRRNSVSERRK
ncbi:uncharacterized protein LOC132303781 [Cornus florida]|uniref:uncharacterized protein LOC132303781 n=1 Tax=Cornus florida TaxID=4283 RepID=UPI00289BC0EC|nr:uncharacterized protein LOC132303781 [Cornus florida]XP_059657186.1 uncharacterized protein LOC132303781 [Cornus florida]XP_059657187.1 uncharacterized protein LOC132303781 [Cornus florida]XP_059657188.1 uncharacterized protein LOC132303781 [Cornus florida]XP_059657189.1 uncharacterized protein LOC132303781 [Cornus florida]XP_059657190.1 uncharacterized protein LOC132303781 [Cornus florida]